MVTLISGQGSWINVITQRKNSILTQCMTKAQFETFKNKILKIWSCNKALYSFTWGLKYLIFLWILTIVIVWLFALAYMLFQNLFYNGGTWYRMWGCNMTESCLVTKSCSSECVRYELCPSHSSLNTQSNVQQPSDGVSLQYLTDFWLPRIKFDTCHQTLIAAIQTILK